MAFVIASLVTKTWVPQYLAFGLGFAAMMLLQKPLIETAERPISTARHLAIVGISTVMGMIAWAVFDAVLGA